MATNVVMPQMGYDMREGTVVRWYKQEGETVDRGEVIADIETDKATVEFEAYTGGVLGRIVAQEGVAVPVGELIAIITDPGESLPEAAPEAATPAPAAEPAPAPETPAVADAPPADAPPSADGRVRASPIARRLARERGIDLSLVSGTGPNGRVTERDVENYQPAASAPASEPAPAPAPAPSAAPVATPAIRASNLSRMRQTIARVTSDSKSTAPHFYVTAEIDMGKAWPCAATSTTPPTRTTGSASTTSWSKPAPWPWPNTPSSTPSTAAIILKSTRNEHRHRHRPGIRPHSPRRQQLREQVAAPDCLRHQGPHQPRQQRHPTQRRVQFHYLQHQNMGMFDVESFTAIIYPPHAAILAVGSVKQQPVVRDGELAVGTMMKATLSTDHRVADGAEAAQFLMEIKRILENPVSLLL